MTVLEMQVLALVHQELGVAPDHVTLASRLDELGDSLTWVGLISAVEADFDIRIDMEQGLALQTVGDLVRLVGEPSLA